MPSPTTTSSHSKSALRSALDGIPGIGPKRQAALRKRFGTVKRIREAEEARAGRRHWGGCRPDPLAAAPQPGSLRTGGRDAVPLKTEDPVSRRL